MHLKQLLAIASLLSMAAATPTPVSAPGGDDDIPFQHPDEQQPNVWYPASKYNHTLARRQLNLLHDIWAWGGNGCTGTAHFMGGYGPACFAVPENKRSLIYATGPITMRTWSGINCQGTYEHFNPSPWCRNILFGSIQIQGPTGSG